MTLLAAGGRWYVWSTVLLTFALLASPSRAEKFQPGEAIEYKVSSDKWERGTIIRELDGGVQYLVREKPTQFFPQGNERAYAPTELRKPQAEAAPAQAPTSAIVAKDDSHQAADKGDEGLLSKEDVLAYSKALFGEGDPFANPRREELLAQIRDYIKSRGTKFEWDLEFDNLMGAQGTSSVHINYAIDANQGQPPKLEDYMGTWLLRVANRGSQSVQPDGSSRVVITTEDSQHESGQLTINKDGTYVWQPFRGDPPDKWMRGTWREVKPDEMNVWEGGPAIWLLKAKQGNDCMVRMNREPGWPNWIDVGQGKARTPVEYGRKE